MLTTPKCIRKFLALLSGLVFRISVLQINTTQETKWRKKPNQVLNFKAINVSGSAGYNN